MDDIVTECSEGVLRVELNRPEKLNAMTSNMYTRFADILKDAAKDERIRVVLWHGAGDAFSAGNDLKDFLEHPPGPGDSPQARLMNALVDFDKPLIAAVRGAAIGGGTTMLLHCDLVYATNRSFFGLLARIGGQVFLTTTQPELILVEGERVDFQVQAGVITRRA